jgi:CheY-like chemotaxis protein
VRLDRYSVRVLAGKELLWADIDKGLVFVALFLGVGVTLLLIALARAKDLQARELVERNRVIEQQVRQQTAELAEARDQALEASRVKSDFLASMSHEIRTPLNAIIGMAELLSETRLTTEQQKYVGVFRNAGEALLSLVNDILDLSKIEASQLTLEDIDFNLIDVVEQAVDTTVRRVDGAPGVVGLRISVADSGIGIPQGKLDSIFASFTQVDSSITRKYGGTGLGLTISKRLVELMDGRVWVESVEGEGSTFHFEVALRAAVQPAADAPALAALRSVLIADGSACNAEMLRGLLASWGVQVDVCADGDAAAHALERARGRGDSYGAVLLDAGIGGEGAFDLMLELRAAADATPVIMLFRPSTVAAGVERLHGMGLSTYLVKPVKRAQLASALGGLHTGTHAAAEQQAQPLADPRAAARILLVEDNADNRLLIRSYLKKEPYQIAEAENGAEAVEQFKAAPFDLVLMDVQMPVMDGYAATRAIRAWEQSAQRPRTPVIALTANAIKEDMDKSLAAGCDDHLTKPIKKQTLLDALNARLHASA